MKVTSNLGTGSSFACALLFVCIILVVGACRCGASDELKGKALKLKVGMTEQDVTDILGEPTTSGGSPPKAYVLEFVQKDDITKRLTVQFSDGKVKHWVYVSMEGTIDDTGKSER